MSKFSTFQQLVILFTAIFISWIDVREPWSISQYMFTEVGLLNSIQCDLIVTKLYAFPDML